MYRDDSTEIYRQKFDDIIEQVEQNVDEEILNSRAYYEAEKAIRSKIVSLIDERKITYYNQGKMEFKMTRENYSDGIEFDIIDKEKEEEYDKTTRSPDTYGLDDSVRQEIMYNHIIRIRKMEDEGKLPKYNLGTVKISMDGFADYSTRAKTIAMNKLLVDIKVHLNSSVYLFESGFKKKFQFVIPN